ncbi:MAG TPA: hypothetical protein VD927_10305, partial [Chryseosolibacter sp.]|nr:hypothetical protein [Chryseosolibacter sp.]
MKKILSYLAAGSLFFGACSDQDLIEKEEVVPTSPSAEVYSRMCATMEVLEAQLAANPGLQDRMMAIENHTSRAIASGRLNAQGKIEIPVVVNVIYRTTAENISDAQIQSQIDVLNEDFNATNADVT